MVHGGVNMNRARQIKFQTRKLDLSSLYSLCVSDHWVMLHDNIDLNQF